MKSLLLLNSIILAWCVASAAEVRWDCFWLHGDSSEGNIGYFDLGHSSPEIGLRYSYNPTGSQIVKIDGSGENVNIGWNVGIWVLAMAGDILSKEYFSQPHIVLKDAYNPMIDQSSMLPQPSPIPINSVGDSVGVQNGDRFYLALIGYWYEDIDPSVDPLPIPELADFYGWVELEATQTDLTILGSAFSYGPLVVGGGAAPTPEPSVGLLVMLGFAALALRRRRTKAAQYEVRKSHNQGGYIVETGRFAAKTNRTHGVPAIPDV